MILQYFHCKTNILGLISFTKYLYHRLWDYIQHLYILYNTAICFINFSHPLLIHINIWLWILEIYSKFSRLSLCPDPCGSVGCGSSHKATGHQSASQSGHKPGLWVQTPIRVRAGGNQSMFCSHITVSLPLFLPPFLSL